MIPNDDKTLYAELDIRDTHYTYARIIAWDNDGKPMIVTSNGLSPAIRFDNYIGVRFLSLQDIERYSRTTGAQRVDKPKPKPEEPTPFKSRFAKLAEDAVRNRERSDLDDIGRMADEFEAKNSNP